MSTVVVGVDGSAAAERALTWAADEAAQRGATLRIVHAHHAPGMPVPYSAEVHELMSKREHEAAEQIVDRAVAAAKERQPELEVKPDLVQGGPAPVLVHASRGADLLVVATRGRGGFAGLLLGSVSQQVVHHAACPVVVVPPER